MYNIDDLYESGKIPDRYYNQLNGRTAQENYKRFKIKKKKKNESIIFSIIQESLNTVMKTALDEIFNGFKTQYWFFVSIGSKLAFKCLVNGFLCFLMKLY